MKNYAFMTAAVILLAIGCLFADAGAPDDTSWSPLTLDTTGETKNLSPTYPIPYSAKWATNNYDRTFCLSAEVVDEAVSYDIQEFQEEEEGVYTWDFTEIPPSELPRGVAYKLSYKIRNGAIVFDEKLSAVSVKLLPEPGFAFVLAVFGLSFLRRK